MATTTRRGSGAAATMGAADPFSSSSSSASFASSINSSGDDDFGAFAAAAPASSSPPAATRASDPFAPPPAPFTAATLPAIAFVDDEYDNPFADIVHEAPKSAGASRTNSFGAPSTGAGIDSSRSSSAPASSSVFFGVSTLQSQAQTSAVSLAFGSPLLSFSPAPTPTATAVAAAPPMSDIADIFAAADASSAPVAKAELLSFSPLLLSPSGAPSSDINAPTPLFLLDSPPRAAVGTTLSESALASRFVLPPPRASSTPVLSPVCSSSVSADAAAKAATFTGHVTVGELLSFSPVASPSTTSFADSFASSSGFGAVASLFGDDDLFSLSTTDLVAEPSPHTAIESTEAASGDVPRVADPFDDADAAALPIDASSRDVVDVAASPVATATPAVETSPLSSVVEPLADSSRSAAVIGDSTSLFETEPLAAETVVEATAADELVSAVAGDTLAGFDIVDDGAIDAPSAAIASSLSSAAAIAADPSDVHETPSSLDTASRLSIPSPVGYSQFTFTSQSFSPATSASDSDGSRSSSSAAAAASPSTFELSATSSEPSQRSFSDSASADSNAAAATSTGDRPADAGYASFSSASSSSPRVRIDTTGAQVAVTATVETDDTEHAYTRSYECDDDDGDDVAWRRNGAEHTSWPTTNGKGAARALDAPSDVTFDEAVVDGRVANVDAFGAAPASAAASSFLAASDAIADDGFGDFAHSRVSGSSPATAAPAAPALAVDDTDDFGDFSQSFPTPNEAAGTADADDDDDDFGDFGQSTIATADDDANDDDDFGDFGQSATIAAIGDNDDDFGDFGQSSASVSAPSVASASAAPSFSSAPSTLQPTDLSSLFRDAFPTPSVDVAPLEPALSQMSSAALYSFTKDLFDSTEHTQSDALITAIYRSAVESYLHDASSTESTAAATAPPTDTEQNTLELRAVQLQHLKYVLTAKIQEAARHDGLFPHGSQQHIALLATVESDDEVAMRTALTGVQDALFASSVNDAMMRIARQAALSAKAKIAEQAAHQQASSRGSLLATTRQLLSRSAGTGSSSHDSSDTAAAAAAAAVAMNSSNGSSSGDDSGGETSSAESSGAPRNRRSGSSDSELGASSSSTGSSHAKGSSGGLMKKFQDRFSSFSSSRGRPRFVSLRRTGQSGEDVRKMELHMDSISGGLDEVKWKCAVFLYDVDEVAQVAPSQISILSYPGKEVLAAKSDRAALLKLLKPGAIWTVDIGASNNDVLNAW